MNRSETLLIAFGVFFACFLGFYMQLIRTYEWGKQPYYRRYYAPQGYTYRQFEKAHAATRFFLLLCLAGWLVSGYLYVNNFQ